MGSRSPEVRLHLEKGVVDVQRYSLLPNLRGRVLGRVSGMEVWGTLGTVDPKRGHVHTDADRDAVVDRKRFILSHLKLLKIWNQVRVGKDVALAGGG